MHFEEEFLEFISGDLLNDTNVCIREIEYMLQKDEYLSTSIRDLYCQAICDEVINLNISWLDIENIYKSASNFKLTFS